MTGLESLALDLAIKPIVEKTIGYVLTHSSLADRARDALGRSPTHVAFERALKNAVIEFGKEHPNRVADLLDGSFLEHEGATVLGALLLRDGAPDPTDLAVRWADSLNVRNPERRATYIREIEPAALDFLSHFRRALKREPELSDLNDSIALERLADSSEALRQLLGAGRATQGTRLDYFRWLVDRTTYVDPRGTFQTHRQVQVKLEDVYVSLGAHPEPTLTPADRRLAQRELADMEERAGELATPGEEVEQQAEQLLHSLQKQHRREATPTAYARVPLADVIRDHDRLVILGDPGSGKSTLVRFLALQQARALEQGRAYAGAELGAARFPILIRIADYVEGGQWKATPLSDFLATYCRIHECHGPGLADLLGAELERGGALVLIDGLDEIVSADDRRAVVGRIDDFVRRRSTQPNHFVVTSRIAGYRRAPLGASFAHYVVQDMDDAQVRLFLQRWCSAVEAAQTPDISSQDRELVTRREVNGILRAMQASQGVRRLAANPLLLRVIALIHRTGAQLPQKRIELYSLAADTLARTWRTAQGVAESALIKEERLTRLLGRLAYWMHSERPTGIATEREVRTILGAEWARIVGASWDPDEPDPRLIEEVDQFLLAVREHTGLFVERAPKRFGFMHLTFEEYYAARYLVARRASAVGMIRGHLHNPRWDEPILLALGFLGLGFPEDAAALFETAVLAGRNDDSEKVAFHPSEQEEILGRDFLFAVRCLGDRIPVAPGTLNELVHRLGSELVYRSGSARFSTYRNLLIELLPGLNGSEAAPALVAMLLSAISTHDSAEIRCSAYDALTRLRQATPDVLGAFVTALDDANREVRRLVAANLGQLGQATPDVLAALTAASTDSDTEVCRLVAASLGQLGQGTHGVVTALIPKLRDRDAYMRSTAANALLQLGKSNPEAIAVLTATLRDEDVNIRRSTAAAMRNMGQATGEVLEVLAESLRDPDTEVRRSIAHVLAEQEETTPVVLIALIATLHDRDEDVRNSAAGALVQLGPIVPQALVALIAALGDVDTHVRRSVAASLGNLAETTPEILEALMAGLTDTDILVRRSVVGSLGQLGQATPGVLAALMDTLGDSDVNLRVAAANALVQLGRTIPEGIAALMAALADPEVNTRRTAARALQALRQPPTADGLDVLVAALGDADSKVRQAVASTLGQLGEITPWALETLSEALGDPDVLVRIEVADALLQLGQTTPNVVVALTTALRDPNESVRRWAATNLAQLGQTSPEVLSALTSALRDPDAGVRHWVATSLAQLGQTTPEVLSALTTALRSDSSVLVRTAAAEGIAKFTDSHIKITECLWGGLSDTDAHVCEASAQGLAAFSLKFPKLREPMIKRLVGALLDPTSGARPMQGRTASDFAFDALAAIISGSAV